VPPNLALASLLEDELANGGARCVNSSGGYVGPVLKAEFQANAAIVGWQSNVTPRMVR
jgi:hypothetical protein